MDIKILIALLPAVFLFHDFEEIIMMRPWMNRNRDELAARYPFMKKMIQKNHDKLSTSGFAAGIFFIFLVLTSITIFSLYFDSYNWWFAAFIVLSLHFIVHIIQCIVYGKYVPVFITSVLSLPYSVYTYIKFMEVYPMSWQFILLWIVIGSITSLFVMAAAFFIAGKFETWKNKNYPNISNSSPCS